MLRFVVYRKVISMHFPKVSVLIRPPLSLPFHPAWLPICDAHTRVGAVEPAAAVPRRTARAEGRLPDAHRSRQAQGQRASELGGDLHHRHPGAHAHTAGACSSPRLPPSLQLSIRSLTASGPRPLTAGSAGLWDEGNGEGQKPQVNERTCESSPRFAGLPQSTPTPVFGRVSPRG
jgi:hypothetical protein